MVSLDTSMWHFDVFHDGSHTVCPVETHFTPSLSVRAPPGVPCEVPACHATLTEHAQWIARVESMLEQHANGEEGSVCHLK